ncbi:uncharacterized protein LOC142232135 [Haematobia irritans]|uniref:uncharacterized protein LOC142232135 n=1 Tax=Haematobia irritans TaxID=7368 RepID=UPI003F4FDF06
MSDAANVTATLEATFNNSTYYLFANIEQSPIGNNLTQDDIDQTLYPTSQGPQRSSRSFAFEVPIWLILCYSIILLFAIVGNLLVIIILAQNRRMRTITNVFLLNLAISDILLGVLCMPVTLVGTLLRNFIFGEYFCKLIQFSQAASVAVSSWTLVAISCERYYAICHPLRSRRWQTRSHAYKIIASIWFGSMLCMTPIALFSQLMPTSRQGYRKCRENWPSYAMPYERPYNIFLDLVLLVLPLFILSVAYILITRTLYVGMRIEKAMIFGGGSCNGKLNSDEMYTTLQKKNPTSFCGVASGGTKGMYITTAPSTPTSSVTTMASMSSSMSRFKSQLSLRRHGHSVQTNINTKHNAGIGGGAGVGGVAAGNVNIANAHTGVTMRSHLMHNRSVGGGSVDSAIQETDVYPQNPQLKAFNQHQRILQQQQQQQHQQQLALHRQQQQSHCHNYHQQLMHHNVDYEQDQEQTTTTAHESNKLFCENISRFCCGGKRSNASSTNTSSNGRRHLYCMRFATLRSVPTDNDSMNTAQSYCTSECCSNNCIGPSGGGLGCSSNVSMGGCCNNGNFSMGITGNLPSSSTTSLASSSTSYSYRYQMQQQYYHHSCNVPRNNLMQQVNPEFYGKNDTGRKLFSSSKRNLRSSDSVLRRNNIAKNLESKKRVVKMLSVLVLEFFICWTPLYVINTVAMYIGSAIYEYIDYKSISALQLLAYSSSCCNPITYCFMNANFRRAFLDTFKGMHWCGKRFRRKRSTAQNGNLCLAGNSSIRVNSCTVQTVIDSPRL